MTSSRRGGHTGTACTQLDDLLQQNRSELPVGNDVKHKVRSFEADVITVEED